MKHPVLENRVRLTLWWLVWLFVALGQALSYYFAYGGFLKGVSAADSLLSLLIYSGIALSLWYPISYFNDSGAKPITIAVNIVVTGIFSITLWIVSTRVLLDILLSDNDNLKTYWQATFPYRIGSGVFIYGMVILSYYLFVSMYKIAGKKEREAKLENLVKETELKMLRSQINPHFLFNSLNSISSLTISDPSKARDMVVKLSDFMRYALSRKDEQPVTLSGELENLRLYLDIEKVRFGDRLVSEERVEENCLGIKIPVMLLQPLYENAVKHGVYESTNQVRIITEASMRNGYLELSISNSFEEGSLPVKGTGTGLLNVKRRLELCFGNRASLLTAKNNGIFMVKVIIPADYKAGDF
jgi:hypothetical protein